MKRSLFTFAFVLHATVVRAAEPAQQWTFEAAQLRPIWRSSTLEGESVLFIQEDSGARPKAAILFRPTKILAVRSASGEVTYLEGRDYRWQPDTREITLPAGSRIPFKRPQDLRRPANSQRYRLTHRDGNGEILFGATHEYHDMQTAITYEHTAHDWSGAVPAFAGAQLPRTVGKLTARQPLCIALLGDSISTGCNASGWSKVAPFQPPYQDLLAMGLEAAYGAKITLKNYAVSGTGTQWGLVNIGKVLQADPDLVMLAFGMNDASGLPAARYQANIKGMIDAVRKARPQCEFILVATMLGNKDWTLLHPELFPQYREALAQLCGPGVALADMTSIWAELLKCKKDWDLTGNGVNHPNDFGHRIYAQVLYALLVSDSRS